MKQLKSPSLWLATCSLAFFGFITHGEESAMEKAETAKNKTVDAAKRTYRSAKEKSCEMINGKLECKKQELGNKVEDLKDQMKTNATEKENKAN